MKPAPPVIKWRVIRVGPRWTVVGRESNRNRGKLLAGEPFRAAAVSDLVTRLALGCTVERDARTLLPRGASDGRGRTVPGCARCGFRPDVRRESHELRRSRTANQALFRRPLSLAPALASVHGHRSCHAAQGR